MLSTIKSEPTMQSYLSLLSIKHIGWKTHFPGSIFPLEKRSIPVNRDGTTLKACRSSDLGFFYRLHEASYRI